MPTQEQFEDPANADSQEGKDVGSEMEEADIVDPEGFEEEPQGALAEEAEEDDEVTPEDAALMEVKAQIEDQLLRSVARVNLPVWSRRRCMKDRGTLSESVLGRESMARVGSSLVVQC